MIDAPPHTRNFCALTRAGHRFACFAIQFPWKPAGTRCRRRTRAAQALQARHHCSSFAEMRIERKGGVS